MQLIPGRGLQPGGVVTPRQRRRNRLALVRYFAFMVGVVVLYSVLFHVVAAYEGQEFTWITGVYWTLTTMTTLGLGDIVFTTDLGKIFTSAVLVSGILLILVVLPFAFIRFFYAPWLEARRIPERMQGHVVIVRYDNLAPPLIEKFELQRIPYYVIEPDPVRAAALDGHGVSVVTGAIDDRATFDRLRVEAAKLVLANADDMSNTNVTLTVRDIAPTVPIAAIAETEDSVDILRVAGASHVFPLKQRLGEQLANRLNAGHAQTHVIGSFQDLQVAEFPVFNTPFSGRTLREIRLREIVGLNIIGVLEQTRFHSASPDTRLTAQSVPVVIGSRESLRQLDEMLMIYDTNYSPVVVIGGGVVGQAAARMLKRKGLPVHVVEKDEAQRVRIGDLPDRLFIGDATEHEVLLAAGLCDAPGVLLTTHDDALNIYLAIQCRRLAPTLRIVSRITHERNMAAIARAAADLALSHTSLGVESVFAVLRGRDFVVVGEGVELIELPVPPALAGKSLGEAGIAARTGLNVIALREPSRLVTNPVAATILTEDSELVMIGGHAGLKAFQEEYSG